MSDWADELAGVLAADARISPSEVVLDLWAVRLRLARQEGFVAGIEAVREIVVAPPASLTAGTQTIVFHEDGMPS